MEFISAAQLSHERGGAKVLLDERFRIEGNRIYRSPIAKLNELSKAFSAVSNRRRSRREAADRRPVPTKDASEPQLGRPES